MRAEHFRQSGALFVFTCTLQIRLAHALVPFTASSQPVRLLSSLTCLITCSSSPGTNLLYPFRTYSIPIPQHLPKKPIKKSNSATDRSVIWGRAFLLGRQSEKSNSGLTTAHVSCTIHDAHSLLSSSGRVRGTKRTPPTSVLVSSGMPPSSSCKARSTTHSTCVGHSLLLHDLVGALALRLP